ncbi:MAG: transposase [Armatimonadota bacterium]|nr:transposase [Armatimonadota bacterium]
MALGHHTYQPHDAEHSVLHAVIRGHLEPFLRAVSDHGEGTGLPRFVEQEFRKFLTCGVLARGFTRLRCADCTFERLVPFSCKGRGFCPSCGGRRMAEHAAYLVDEVLPLVPVRQWVLTLPYRLRYRLAWDHALCRAVLRVFARALLAFYARTARAHGIQGGQTGTVTLTQRFGSGLQLNIHFHTLVLDGVFSEAQPGRRLTFHPAPPPGDEDVARVLATVRARVGRLLAQRRLEPADDPAPADPLAEASPALAGLVGASVQGRVALGPRAGARVRRVGDEADLGHVGSGGPRQAQLDGFDLHANVWVPPNDRARLEQLARYLLRPPLAQDRIRLRSDGRVLVELKTVWRDGTSHFLFEPIEFLEKLAAIIPRPAVLLYHGVLAPRARWRSQVARYGRPALDGTALEASPRAAVPTRAWTWAALMQRVFVLDVLACPRCGGRLRVIATVQDPLAVQAILAHLRRSGGPAPPGPAPPASAAIG